MLKKWFFFLGFASVLNAASNPLTPGAPIPITDTGTIVSSVMSSGTATNFIITCQDESDNLISSVTPSNVVSWSTPLVTSLSAFTTTMWVSAAPSGYTTVFITNPPGYTTGIPNSVFSTDGTSWGSPSIIVSATAEIVTPFSVCATSGGFLATWHSTAGGFAFSSFSSGSSNTWSTPTLISATINAVSRAVIVSSSTTGAVATWGGNSSNAYASFSSDDGSSWSTPVPITTTNNVNSDVWVSSNSSGFLATWIDNTDNAQSSFFNGTSWSTPAQIPTGITLQSGTNISVSGSSAGFVVAWIGNDNNAYGSLSADNGNSWSTPVMITNDGSVHTSYSDGSLGVVSVTSIGNSCVFTWQGNPVVVARGAPGSGDAYSSFSGLAPVGGLQPPASLTGTQKKNVFAFETDLYNLLNWAPSPSTGVVGYKVYHNGTLVATLNASTFSYEEHDQKRGAATVYSVTAFDANNNESSPVNVTVN